LVSCVGAYEDSGVGTGGLVCLNEGQPVILDKLDSTGLYQDGETFYRFIRSRQSIVGYDVTGVKFLLKLPYSKDVHDIRLIDSQFVCVSTGYNAIQWFDPLGNLIKTWRADGERDAWHLNCLCQAQDRLFVSAFGEFEKHREWMGKRNTGFLLDLATNIKVLTGLSGPHHPRYIDGLWVVCESHAQKLSIHRGEEHLCDIQLDGFTRGLVWDDHYLYVGESADRKAAVVREFSYITVIKREEWRVVDRLLVPFPEIYDLFMITSDSASQIEINRNKFCLDNQTDHIETLEQQVEIGYAEVEKLRYQIYEMVHCQRRPSLAYRIKCRLKRLIDFGDD
jgi:hypothetical protein